MGSNPDKESEAIVQENKPSTDEPPKYRVLLHNDNFTTMDFVIEVLRRYFQKTEEQAVEVMWNVHQQGKGIAGTYPFDIAETKVYQVTEAAKSKGFPLQCTCEPDTSAKG